MLGAWWWRDIAPTLPSPEHIRTAQLANARAPAIRALRDLHVALLRELQKDPTSKALRAEATTVQTWLLALEGCR